TSNSSSNVIEFFRIHNIQNIHEIRSSNGLFGKHHTIKKYMKKYRLNREDVLYIGDETRDIIASKKCHIDVMAVTWGLDTKDNLLALKPNILVEQPWELVQFLDK